MLRAKLLFAGVTLGMIPMCPLCAEEEPNPYINILAVYLQEMSEKLECYFTLEDRPNAQGAFPWLVYIDDGFTPDLDVPTIDALVTHLNQELQDVELQRSTEYPSVVHVIAKDLLVEGYVMDETVDVQYSDLLHGLPHHLGTLLDGKVETPTGGAFPLGITVDLQTEVEVNVENEKVRDVLTGAVSLTDRAYGVLWEAQNWGADGAPPTMRVYYHAEPADEEEPEE